MNCVFPYEHVSSTYKKSKLGFSWKKILSMDLLKVGFLLSSFVVLFLTYIITINISSTQGYYYDQVRKSQERAQFNYNIANLETIDVQSSLRDIINFNPSIRGDAVQYVEVR